MYQSVGVQSKTIWYSEVTIKSDITTLKHSTGSTKKAMRPMIATYLFSENSGIMSELHP